MGNQTIVFVRSVSWRNGFPTKYQEEETSDIPFFKVSDMNLSGNDIYMKTANNYISETTRGELSAYLFQRIQSFLLKVGAAIFLERKRILHRPSCIDNNMAGFTITNSDFDFRFIHYSLMKYRIGDQVNTTALPSLNGSILGEIKIRFHHRLVNNKPSPRFYQTWTQKSPSSRNAVTNSWISGRA